MRFLCLIRYVDDPSRALPKAEGDALLQEHLEYDHALQKAGKYVDSGALAPGREARAVKMRDGKVLVTDGPFAETKEELGGYFIVEAESREEACALAGRIPSARHGWVEVRPFRDLYDDLHPPARRPPSPAAFPTPRFVDGPALPLAGFGTRYTPETMGRIPAQWGHFGAQVGQVPGAGPAAYGLCHEWRDGSMEYVCAADATPGARLPDGWRHIALPATRYAVFAHEGHVSDMTRVASWILREWLPASGRRMLRGLAGGVELVEWYGPKFDPRVGSGDIEFWLPLEG